MFSSTFYGVTSVQTLSDFDVVNFTFVAANTEYSIVLPVGTKKFTLQARGNGKILYRRTSGGPYFTFHPGRAYDVDNIIGTSTQTIILECNILGEIAEIIPWD